MLKSNKGVTITSLTIYVIVATIIVAILAFLNANFFAKINDVTSKVELSGEYSKFISAFLKDVKASDKVIEYSTNKIKFSNNAVYEIRVIEDSEDVTKNKYAIYRSAIKICEGIVVNGDIVPNFNYDYLDNTVSVSIKFDNGEYSWEENGTYKVGRGY